MTVDTLAQWKEISQRLVISSMACEGAPLATAIPQTGHFLNKQLNLCT